MTDRFTDYTFNRREEALQIINLTEEKKQDKPVSYQQLQLLNLKLSSDYTIF